MLLVLRSDEVLLTLIRWVLPLVELVVEADWVLLWTTEAYRTAPVPVWRVGTVLDPVLTALPTQSSLRTWVFVYITYILENFLVSIERPSSVELTMTDENRLFQGRGLTYVRHVAQNLNAVSTRFLPSNIGLAVLLSEFSYLTPLDDLVVIWKWLFPLPTASIWYHLATTPWQVQGRWRREVCWDARQRHWNRTVRKPVGCPESNLYPL